MRLLLALLLVAPAFSGCLEIAEEAATKELDEFGWSGSAGGSGEGYGAEPAGSLGSTWRSYNCLPLEPYAICSGHLEIAVYCWSVSGCEVELEVTGYVNATESLTFDLVNTRRTLSFDLTFTFDGPSAKEGETAFKATFFTKPGPLPRFERFALEGDAQIEFKVR